MTNTKRCSYSLSVTRMGSMKKAIVMIRHSTEILLIQIFLFVLNISFVRAQDSNIDICAEEDFSQYFGRNDGAFGRFILHVDLRDVWNYHGAIFPESQTMLESFTDEETGFLPRGIEYSPQGPTRDHDNNQVYGIEIQKCPMVMRDRIEFTLQMFYQRRGVFSRRLFIVIFDRVTSQITDIMMYKDSEWTDRSLQIELSLIERKVLVMNQNGKTLKTYPVAVGGLSPNALSEEFSLLTPRYEDANLNFSVSRKARTLPRYFLGMPFLRITRGHSLRTGLGFHIRQNPQLKRGMESHGCIRMREKDLYELYQLLKNTKDGIIPLSIHFFSEIPWDHPYPLTEDSYRTVSPRARRGEDGLLLMHRVFLDLTPLKDFLKMNIKYLDNFRHKF